MLRASLRLLLGVANQTFGNAFPLVPTSFLLSNANQFSLLAATLQSRGWRSKGRGCRCAGEGQPVQEALGALLTGAKTNSLIK